MSSDKPPITEFRRRLRDREHLVGTFIKIPTSHSTEIMGELGFDFVIVDQEHGPFDWVTIDMMALAGRAAGIAVLVRVAEPSPSSILSVLDKGAAGVMVPHVDTPAKARAIAAACRYRGGSRGYSNTTRAGRFGGAAMAEHIAAQDAQATCVAMIEDVAAVDEIEAIAAVEGIDAFFIGRGDLTAALGSASPTSPETRAVVEPITAAARSAAMPIMVLAANRADGVAMAGLGATAFVVSNDQNLMKQAAEKALKDFAAPMT